MNNYDGAYYLGPGMFSMSFYLNHSKNNQMVRAEKGDFVRSRNRSALKLTIRLGIPISYFSAVATATEESA